MHIKVRRIPQVDAHVNGLPNPLSTLQNCHSLAKRNPCLHNSLVMCICACGVSVVVISVAVVQHVLVAAVVRFRPTLVVRDSHTVHRLRRQQIRVLFQVRDDRSNYQLSTGSRPSFVGCPQETSGSQQTEPCQSCQAEYLFRLHALSPYPHPSALHTPWTLPSKAASCGQ
jgi:hypothetical protein